MNGVLSHRSYEPTYLVLDLSLSQTLDIFKLLTQTYPRYVDSASREAVETVGIELVRRDELRGTSPEDANETKLGVTEQIVGWLANEVDKFAKRSRCVFDLKITIFLGIKLLEPQCISPLRHVGASKLGMWHLCVLLEVQP